MAKKTPGSERARRLMAVAGHLTPGKRVPIAELAQLVGTSEAELTRDLETLTMCGVSPYAPDDLTPIYLEDGCVVVFGDMSALVRPVRLSPAEATALAAALQAAGFSADDDLTVRLLDAAGSTAFDVEELARTIRTASAGHDVDIYEALSRAVQEHAVVRLEYAKGGTDAISVREVEPIALFAERAAWYVRAWCRFADDWRTFRLDRIRSAGLTGETFDPSAHPDAPTGTTALDTDGLPCARLRFDATEPFSDREWPGGRVVESLPDGGVIAEVPYARGEWLARRVAARLGGVELVSPPELRVMVTEIAGRSARR